MARCRGWLVLALIAAGVAAGGAENLAESFEAGIPAHVVASRPGSVRASDEHSKHGRNSLRWDWQAGDTLTFRHGLGDIARQGGYGGSYSKATFGVWVYAPAPAAGSVELQTYAGETASGRFRFPLAFRGWQRAHLRYTWQPQFEGAVAKDTDRIVVRAPEAGSGCLFIDLLVYNGIMDYRQQHLPGTAGWQPAVPDPARFPLPTAITPAEAAGVAAVEERLDAEARGALSVTPALLDDLAKAVAEWRVERNPDGTPRGRPVVPSPDYYREVGLNDVDDPTAITRLMLRLAQAHANAGDADARRRLAAWYVDLADHLADQGMVPGVGFAWNWYGGRDLASATFLMRGSLQDAGRLEREVAYFDSNYGCTRIFDDATIAPNMDYFHNDLRNMMRGSVMQSSAEGKARALEALSRRLSLDILREGHDGFRPDGSAFHHGMHYFAYAHYSTSTLCSLLRHLTDTPFQVSPEALARVRQVILAMRFYCNERHLPLPLCGRHPHSQELSAGKFLDLAMACGTARPDAELLAAYLRLEPEKAGEEPFRSLGARPEPTPNGTLSLPHAGLLAVRQGPWLAVVKGYSRYVAFGEIYAENNRYGRYLSNGYLDVLAGGQPVTRRGSGCGPEGWDWNRLDGTTVIVLEPERLTAVSRGTEGIPSEETFCGAVTGAGDHAVFGLRLRGAKQHDPSFEARKSYHWIGPLGAFVCLGSGIACADREHPVQTTLFQKGLPTPEMPILLDGQGLSGLDLERTPDPAAGHWLLDPQGTAYVIPAGQALTVARRRQTNPDHTGKRTATGDFACAWLDHGKAPAGGTYQYLLKPACTPDSGADLARLSTEPASAPWAPLRCDPGAHAVRAVIPTATVVSAALFEPGTVETGVPALPTLGADRPCLALAELSADGLVLSVTDPDLRLDSSYRSQPAPTTVRLPGRWQADPRAAAEATLRPAGPDATDVVLTGMGGMPQRIALRRTP